MNRIRIVDASSNILPNALVSSRSVKKCQNQEFCVHVKRTMLTKITD